MAQEHTEPPQKIKEESTEQIQKPMAENQPTVQAANEPEQNETSVPPADNTHATGSDEKTPQPETEDPVPPEATEEEKEEQADIIPDPEQTAVAEVPAEEPEPQQELAPMPPVKPKWLKRHLPLLVVSVLAVAAAGAIIVLINQNAKLKNRAEEAENRPLPYSINDAVDAMMTEDPATYRTIFADITESKEKYTAFCRQILSDYVTGEISYNSALARLQYAKNLVLDIDTYNEVAASIEVVHEEEKILNLARVRLFAGDYYEAFDLFQGLLESDYFDRQAAEGVEFALSRIDEATKNQCAPLLEAEDFDGARAIVNAVLEQFPGRQTLLDMLTSIDDEEIAAQERHREEALQNQIAQARDSARNGDFDAAFSAIASLAEGNPDREDIKAAQAEIMDLYCRSVFEAALSAETPTAGIAMIDEALKRTDNPRLIEAKAYLQSLAPVSLSALTVADGASPIYDTGLTDAKGNEYSHSMYATGEITFTLDRKYTSFSGVVSCVAGVASTEAHAYVVLEVYADGDNIYKSPKMLPAEEPQQVELDVTGKTTITFRWKLHGTGADGDWSNFATIYDGVFEVASAEKPVY